MIRGIISNCVEGLIKRFTATGRPEETISNREYMQHYGFSSRPLSGAEIIILREGGLFVAVASDDRRYRITLENGEVALYDDLGQKVHLTRTGIEVQSPTSITATAPQVTVIASTKVTMTTPLLEVSGNITSGGNITATGNVLDAGGTKSMSGMRGVYNAHTHPENGTGGGTTSQPNQGQ